LQWLAAYLIKNICRHEFDARRNHCVERDAIIVGGRVLDFDGDLDLPAVADIFIENGRIAAVGKAASQRAMNRSDVERIDAAGKLVIPGLVNAHYHSHDVMLRGLFEQMPLDVWGFYSFPGNYSRRSRADIYLRTVLGATECLVNGITTVQDMVTVVGDDREHVDAILGGYEDCGARVVLGLQVVDRAAADCVPYWDGLSQHASSQLRRSANTAGLQKLIEELIVGGAAATTALGLGSIGTATLFRCVPVLGHGSCARP
jgi:5-methylthioadenosine/S-adenosylhomocysteine deaminase